jgi:hypothetical protein
MGARWYDPSLNRFLSPDSIIPQPGNPQSLNRYSYVYNNPLGYTDPSGHAPTPNWLTNLQKKISMLANEILRRPAGGTPGSNSWFDTDWAGCVILDRYLSGGGGDWTIANDPDWEEYMEANPKLKQNMQDHAISTAQDLYAGGWQPQAISESSSQKIGNGESIVGYDYLHGSNSLVGDFQIQGTAQLFPEGTGYRAELSLTYTWNDIIDDKSETYWSDWVKNTFAEIITMGKATPYNIHISWQETTYVYLDQNGNVVDVDGSWLGY